MNGYYFVYYHNSLGRLPLARVWAKNETEAKAKALVDHSWCGVKNTKDLLLIQINSTTMYC
tara:strand:- start:7 stop:189 length:183 start_codon:yes stop_codon:yes gene_type:complete